MPLHVLHAHIHVAFEAEHRRHRGYGNPMLSGPCLRNNPALSHPAREENLAYRVIDLVRPGMTQVFALQINLRTTELFGEPLREIERGGSPDVLPQIVIQLCAKLRISTGFSVDSAQLFQCGNQGFRNVAAAESAEATAFIGNVLHNGSV